MRSFGMRLALTLLGAIVATIALVLLVREEPRITQIVIVKPPVIPVVAAPVVIAKPHTVTTTCMTDAMVPVVDPANGFDLCPSTGSCMTLEGEDVARPTASTHSIEMRDKPRHAPLAEPEELEIAGTAVLGSRELVVRPWSPAFTGDAPPPPWAPARGKIVDARGVVTAKVSVASDIANAVIDVGDDGYMILDDYGGFRLVVDGAINSYGELRDWHAADQDVDPALNRIEGGEPRPVQMVRLPDDPREDVQNLDGSPGGSARVAHLAATWCDYDNCFVAKLDIGFATDEHHKKIEWIQRPMYTPYPLCH